MKTQYKVILILIVVLLIVVSYSKWKIDSLESTVENLTTSLTTATTANDKLKTLLQSSEESIAIKEDTVKKLQQALQSISEQLEGLKDEESKDYLNSSTPTPIVQLLESTDYYHKASSSKSSSSVSSVKY